MTTILTGHVSPETAYVVADYPYGFRLRCKIRYWLERTKHGVRLVSQTTNPKVAYEKWNKPKASTYHDVAVMYLDDESHVHIACLGMYDSEEDIAAFVATYGHALTAEDLAEVKRLRVFSRAGKLVTWEVTTERQTRTADEQKAHDEEQKAILRRAVGVAAGQIKKEEDGDK